MLLWWTDTLRTWWLPFHGVPRSGRVRRKFDPTCTPSATPIIISQCYHSFAESIIGHSVGSRERRMERGNNCILTSCQPCKVQFSSVLFSPMIHWVVRGHEARLGRHPLFIFSAESYCEQFMTSIEDKKRHRDVVGWWSIMMCKHISGLTKRVYTPRFAAKASGRMRASVLWTCFFF